MKGSQRLVTGLATAGLVLTTSWHWGRAQTQPGPGVQPATLKVPWLETSNSAPSAPAIPSTGSTSVVAASAAAASPAAANLTQSGGSSLPKYEEKPDPNEDIRVRAAQGPWLICLTSYTGPEAPAMARKMVMELRNTYKLPAFVFNRGAEERRKEFEHRHKLIEEKRELYKKLNVTGTVTIRVPHIQVEDQCAVLIGGYESDEAATRALKDIRKLSPPDPKRVSLTTIYEGQEDSQRKIDPKKILYVNPFMTAFVVRNPEVKQDRPADWDKPDMALLQKLNSGENYSLLACKKPFTLVVKTFMTPAAVQPQSATGKFLEALGLGGKNNGLDTAAQNAHNLAELMRKTGLDAYVLHTRYSSLVTVGGFDNPDDPNLRSTRDLLMTRLKVPQALPMAVPR
jgi:hypothetical protein